MTNYTSHEKNGVWWVIDAATNEPIKSGPYKNEESAKRRIRDLKRKDAENAAEREQIIKTIAADLTTVEVSTNVAVGNEFPNWTPSFDPTPRPSHYVEFRQPGKPETEFSRRYQTFATPEMIRVSKALMARPIGVYPAVAKKFYRQQWR